MKKIYFLSLLPLLLLGCSGPTDWDKQQDALINQNKQDINRMGPEVARHKNLLAGFNSQTRLPNHNLATNSSFVSIPVNEAKSGIRPPILIPRIDPSGQARYVAVPGDEAQVNNAGQLRFKPTTGRSSENTVSGVTSSQSNTTPQQPESQVKNHTTRDGLTYQEAVTAFHQAAEELDREKRLKEYERIQERMQNKNDYQAALEEAFREQDYQKLKNDIRELRSDQKFYKLMENRTIVHPVTNCSYPTASNAERRLVADWEHQKYIAQLTSKLSNEFGLSLIWQDPGQSLPWAVRNRMQCYISNRGYHYDGKKLIKVDLAFNNYDIWVDRESSTAYVWRTRHCSSGLWN